MCINFRIVYFVFNSIIILPIHIYTTVYYIYSQIGTLIEELLVEMLFYLSSIYLEINSHWPGGTDVFRNQMIQSFKNFPKTPKDICLALINSKNTDIKNATIIFIYFYLLTCSK